MDSSAEVFLSYAHEDRVFVEGLAGSLEAEGISVWYDRHLKPGRPWSPQIEQHIEEAKHVVVVLTPASAGSDYVRKEIHYAEERGKPRIPVLLRETEVPLPLIDLQWVDARKDMDPMPVLLAALRGGVEGVRPARTLPKPPDPVELGFRVRQNRGGFQAVLRLGDRVAGPFAFEPPLDSAALGELRWYLEAFPRWPTETDFQAAERIERQMREWGRRLFRSVLEEEEAADLWKAFIVRTDRPRLLTLDAEDQEVLRLPWELMADGGHHVFSLGVDIRRRCEPERPAEAATFQLPIRILMVVSRPEEEGVSFIDPRAASRALLDAVEPLGAENVAVEFLHPPTVEALRERLGRTPAVHVVHFDGHGVYLPAQGLGCLIFEAPDGKADPVGADRLGDLLAQSRTPLMVLDACQSAHADAPDPYSSVAMKLVRSGVGSVVAMQYSVLVETSKRFMRAFYRSLAGGQGVGRATNEGRSALLADPHRLTHYGPDGSERRLSLRDWALPALYQQEADPAPFAGARVRPVTEGVKSDVLLGEFPEAPFGFVGRERELWRLERLFHDRRVVVLHGFGGQGKTALATEAAAWLTRTGRFRRAVFLSFERGGERDWALMQLGRLMVGEDFSSLGEGERLSELKKALTEGPTLLVWDNFESILPQGEAALPEDALGDLLDLGAELVKDNRTRLLATTRDPDLPHDAFRPSKRAAQIELSGLGAREALELAGAVFDAFNHDRPPRLELERLLDFLGGHPLSIQLVMPKLKDYGNDVGAVIEGFERLYPGFTAGRAKERHESLEVSLSFSLRRLSEGVRERLPALGVFAGGALDLMVVLVCEIRPEEWVAAREELIRAGLVRQEPLLFPLEAFGAMLSGKDAPEEMWRQMAAVPYLRFHPTLAPYLRRRLDKDQREALEGRYRDAYYVLSTFLYQQDSRTPHEARGVALRELPNLRRALDLMLAAGETDRAVDFVDNLERFLNVFGRWRERDAMMAAVERVAKGAAGGAEGLLTKSAFLLASRRGEMLLGQGRAREAERAFRDLLRRMDAGADYDSAYDRAITLHRIGRSLRAQGRAREAEAKYRRALDALATMDLASVGVQRETGGVHTELADVLAEQGRYAEARQEYEKALTIARSTGDRRQEAVVLGQIGTLALMQQDFAEAQKQYREALKAFRALGETQSEAICWHQLGMVAQEVAARAEGEARAAALEEADRCYRESLRLKEGIGDRALAATTANQLALVAGYAGRHADAERWYRRALSDFEVSGQQRYVAVCANNLAALLLRVSRLPGGQRPAEFTGRDLLAEAEALARRAAEIRESIGDPSLEVWMTYGILAGIARERKDGETARVWRQKERVAYAAFPGHWARYEGGWLPHLIAIRDTVQGNKEAAEAVRELLSGLDKRDDWRNLAAAIRRVLDGARDAEALADELGLDGADYLILTKALAAVEGRLDAPQEGADDPRARTMEAFRAWLGGQAGQAALREVQAQASSGEEALRKLFERFAQGQAT